MAEEKRPPVCDYTDSDYQASFWEQGGREYEDLCEAIALRHLLPGNGRRMLELGAGAGRNTPRYTGYERIVLLDYSRTQLEQAKQRLGADDGYLYVAADIYRLPFAAGLFDGATMIRVLHHMADAPAALRQVWRVMQPGGIFILEFASKHNLKAILRYWLKKQAWSPFTPQPVEFTALNFDFHPKTVFRWLDILHFEIQRVRTVSHFRVGLLKRLLPAHFLAWLDGLLQGTGRWWQLSPSVFVRTLVKGMQVPTIGDDPLTWFRCPECGSGGLQEKKGYLLCPGCKRKWEYRDGIYDFREAMK